MEQMQTRSNEQLEAERKHRSVAFAILGARAAERYDADTARGWFQKAMVASTHPQERMQIRRMADASLALAERRAGDLKTAVEKLGQEAPSARALFGLRVMGLIAPPKSMGIVARLRGVAVAIVVVIVADRPRDWHRRADRSRRPTARRRPPRWLAAILERAGVSLVHNRGRRQHGRRDRLDAARRVARRRAAHRRRARPVRGRRVLARLARRPAATRARCCSATCSATSSTATASSRRSPTAGPRSCDAARPSVRAGAERRRPADRRPRPRAPGVTLLRRRGRLAGAAGMQHAADSKHCRRCGAPTCSTRSTSATSATTTARAAVSAAAPTVSATSVALEGVRAARFTLRTPPASAEVALALPGLYNVYNALAAAALCLALGDRRCPRSSPG
jgi:hypothetical protein